VVRRQHLWRSPGCRGWRRSHGAAGRRDPVPIHFPLSGALYFPRQLTKEQLVSVLPLLLNCLETQEVVVYTYAAVALDRTLCMRGGGSTTLMYACGLPLLPSPRPYRQFSGSHLRACSRSHHSLSMSSSSRSASRTARSARRRTASLGAVRAPFVLRMLVPDGCLSQVLRESSSRRSGACRRVRNRSAEARRHPPQSRPNLE
jgi:hypothetical protein